MMPSARALAPASLAPLLLLLTPGLAGAYRPFDGTDADVAERGELELELGPLHYAREDSDEFLLTSIVLNLGVAAGLELDADLVPVYPLHGPVQLSDTDVVAKYLLRPGVLQDAGGPSIAIEAGALLPEVNGESGLGTAVKVIVSERWSRLTLHLNDEGQLGRGDLAFEYAASLIAEVDLGCKLLPVAELGFEIEPSSGAKSYSALTGVIWTIADELALDAAARAGRADGVNTFEMRLGFTWPQTVWGE